MAAKKPKKSPEERQQENLKRQKFIEEYFKCNMNGTQAAKNAGYSEATAYSQANRLLKNVEIRAEIDRRLKAMQIGADEVLTRLSQHATGTLRYFVTPLGEIDLTTPEAQAHFHLLKKVRRTEARNGDVTIEIEVHDPQAALVHVGKYHKLFVDRTEMTGKDGEPIIILKTGMSMDDL